MAEKLEKKLDSWTRGMEAIKKFLKSLKSFILWLMAMFISIYLTWENRKTLFKDLVHDEVVAETDLDYSKSELRKRDSVFIAEEFQKLWKEIGRDHRVGNRLSGNTAKLEDRIVTLEEGYLAQEKHLIYHDGNINNIITATKGLFKYEKDESCNVEWREGRHKGRFIVIYKDSYGCDSYYELKKSSNCRYYYIDLLTGNKIMFND